MRTVKHYLKRIALIGILLIAARAATASSDELANDPIEKLLKQKLRPTVAEFVTAMNEKYGVDGWPKVNPFVANESLSGKTAAVVIASFERAYPGANYFSLGRDVAMLNDLLDAFYTSIGQPHRVRRLNASGPSFPHYYNSTTETAVADRELLMGFLAANNLDLSAIEKDYPWVMFDVTSWRSTSQSRQLIRAAYQTYAARGGDLKLLRRRVNFIGVPMGSAGGNEIAPALDIENVKNNELKNITSEGPYSPLYAPSQSTRFTYTSGWHEMFGPFTLNSDNTVTTQPGANIQFNHNVILGELFAIATLVKDANFFKTVNEAANELGYEFPKKRTEQLEFLAVEKIPAPNLFVKPQSNYPIGFYNPSWKTRNPDWADQNNSADGREDMTWYGKPKKPDNDMSLYMDTANTRISQGDQPMHVALELFKDLAGMLDRGTASASDLRQFFKICRKNYLLEDGNFMKDLGHIAIGRPRLNKDILEALSPLEKYRYAKNNNKKTGSICETLLSLFDDTN